MLVITFLLTVLIDLTVAVQVGVVFSALIFIRRMSEISNVGVITRELNDDKDEIADPNSIRIREVPDGVEVFEIQGPFFFGAVDAFRNAVSLVEKKKPVIILRLRNVPVIDATGLHVLRQFHHDCVKDGTALVLSGVHAQPLTVFKSSGLWDQIGEENLFVNIDDALNRARQILSLPPQSVPRASQ